MRICKSRFLLVGFLLAAGVMLSGCAAVIQQIQQTTGSKIEEVDRLSLQKQKQVEQEEEPDAETEKSLSKSPAPHIKLEEILNDAGQGEYAGEKYDRNEVINALKQMPKGLSDDKAYAYLLGLVGENYKQDVEVFDILDSYSYEDKAESWRKVKKPWLEIKNQTASGNGQTKQPPKLMNYVVLLDASGSMDGKLEEQKKMDAVKTSLTSLAAHFAKKDVQFQLRVYGFEGSPRKKDRALSCNSTKKIYASFQFDKQDFTKTLEQVKPTGYNPLALALFKAKADLKKDAPAKSENHIIVITDGYDNCDGNPEKMAQLLHLSDSVANVHVIGLDVGMDTEEQLRKIADYAGGDYATVETEQELGRVLISELNRLKQKNQPWAIRALDAVNKAHHYDEHRLDQIYIDMHTKVDQESERLNETNHYIKSDRKIDQRTFNQINSWIQLRNKQLKNYANKRFGEIGIHLDEKYQEQVSGLLKDWEEAGGSQKQIQEKKEQLMKENSASQYHRNMQIQMQGKQ
ncbi:vWA domain-containing protein [Thermoactinomyces mirandus]|uniref:VWA domain-containing protein n=1 Tax=Thermoactinomyces mirandus TaxID=2756294 RepID=A0A7W1XU96_9BACL|nr:VWA domain-containing protein [Thermoactinomyces mirandus]MBA4603384.1 VWA domain-containing protein [Thermoactinomyces mirandus]